MALQRGGAAAWSWQRTNLHGCRKRRRFWPLDLAPSQRVPRGTRRPGWRLAGRVGPTQLPRAGVSAGGRQYVCSEPGDGWEGGSSWRALPARVAAAAVCSQDDGWRRKRDGRSAWSARAWAAADLRRLAGVTEDVVEARLQQRRRAYEECLRVESQVAGIRQRQEGVVSAVGALGDWRPEHRPGRRSRSSASVVRGQQHGGAAAGWYS